MSLSQFTGQGNVQLKGMTSLVFVHLGAHRLIILNPGRVLQTKNLWYCINKKHWDSLNDAGMSVVICCYFQNNGAGAADPHGVLFRWHDIRPCCHAELCPFGLPRLLLHKHGLRTLPGQISKSRIASKCVISHGHVFPNDSRVFYYHVMASFSILLKKDTPFCIVLS